MLDQLSSLCKTLYCSITTGHSICYPFVTVVEDFFNSACEEHSNLQTDQSIAHQTDLLDAQVRFLECLEGKRARLGLFTFFQTTKQRAAARRDFLLRRSDADRPTVRGGPHQQSVGLLLSGRMGVRF